MANIDEVLLRLSIISENHIHTQIKTGFAPQGELFFIFLVCRLV